MQSVPHIKAAASPDRAHFHPTDSAGNPKPWGEATHVRRDHEGALALHPVGSFVAELVSFGEIKASKVQPSRFVMSAVFETQHGKLWFMFNGTPDTLMAIKHCMMFTAGHKSFPITVKHRPDPFLSGKTWAQMHIEWNSL